MADAEAVSEREPERIERAAADGRSRAYPCVACGADLVVPPGAAQLTCPYCANVETIPLTAAAIREHALHERLGKPPVRGLGAAQHRELRCAACAAEILAEAAVATRPCPYCGGHLVAKHGSDGEDFRPEAVLPFRLDRAAAEQAVKTWAAKLWFAPSRLAREMAHGSYEALYLPHWTFDSHTLSHWSGEAGHRRTHTTGSGKRRRTVTTTRWVSRSGVHERFFDDMLVPAGAFAGSATVLTTPRLKPYDPAWLAGHVAQRAMLAPEVAWPQGKATMDTHIAADVRRLIGGDTQRNVQIATAHRAMTYKLVLLPRWQGGYSWHGSRFRLTVDGASGLVSGDRPWSWVKITLACIAVAAALGGVAMLVMQQQR